MVTESPIQCPQCGRPWPGLSAGALRGGCPLCLLEFAFGVPEPVPELDESEALTRLGPYEILRELGRGGMGVVYQARHTGLERAVALKVLHPACARQPGFPPRFQREGQLLAALSHPHIVGVHDLGCESGVYYLAMELIEGRNLRQVLGEGPLPWPRALAVITQLCDALQCAHEHGIVHRDVKPENVLLDASGQVKVGDFGIAKLLAEGAATPGTLTDTDALLGTRCYMAPEQLERGKEIDHRADVYALAAVFYEMLTGELPLGVFAPPSRKAGIDPRLDAVILRALAKSPGERYASARDFKTAVLRTADRPPLRQRLARVAVLGGALLLLSLVLILPARWHSAAEPLVTTAESPRGWRELTGHTGHVWDVAFAREGKLLASASEDKTVKLWAPESGKCTATLPALPGNELGPVRLALSPDGKTLAAVGRENLVRLWDLEKQQERTVLRGHTREVYSVAFSPDGATLATGDQEQHIILWDVKSGNKRHQLNWRTDVGLSHPILSLAFSPDGTLLAGATMSGEIRLWDPSTGEPASFRWGHARRVWGIAFAPDSSRLASADHDGQIKLWEVGLPRATPRTLVAESPVWAVAFSPDGRSLASGSQDGIVKLWDVANGRLSARLTGHADKVVAVAFAPDGRRLATGSWDQTVRLWDVPAAPQE